MAPVSEKNRRGLPRVEGGEPWPPAGETPASTSGVPPAQVSSEVSEAAPSAAPFAPVTAPTAASVAPVQAAPAAAAPPESGRALEGITSLRRGMPRIAQGEPWPPAGFAPATAAPKGLVPMEAGAALASPAANMAANPADPVPAMASAEPVAPIFEPAPETKPAPDAEVAPAPAVAQKPAAPEKKPKPEAKLYGPRTLGQWVKLGLFGLIGAVVAAAVLVLAARGVTTLPGVPAFLKEYPGEYHLPEAADQGFPWWAQWTHFLNFFLMVLIIRSGYQVRTQHKPPAFWTPKRGGKKISINLWLHQSLDILWLLNGLIFVVLLFISGHWMRIVPTSWEVFPNALSALLQYMTLEWPVENGWVNYNSLQQLMYFIIVFIAAPLAALTGARMSELWPENAKTLNRIYPVEAARAIHFPTMLFFVLFILIHVFLVLSTGALRNLNHMFAGTDVINWTGLWLFAAAIAVTAGAWFAARPLVLAPIAKLFGRVSSR